MSLLSKIPLVKHLKGYQFSKFRSDARAGLNVALLDFPQGMAYAMIAGFPVQVGIYSSAIGSVTGPLFASSRFLMLGPTNAISVMVLSSFISLHIPDGEKLILLPLLTLLVGLFMLIGAFIGAHVVTRFVSRTVITGYISAAALLIIANQLNHVLDLTLPRAGTFWETVFLLGEHFGETNWAVLAFSLGTVLLYLCLSRFLPKLPNVALTLASVSLLYHFGLQDILTLSKLPAVPVGVWPLTLPDLGFQEINRLASAAFAVAFLSLVESASIAKTLAAQSGDNVNVRQQMVSMGVADVANAFGSGMPVSGSLTRSTLNLNSGAVSPMSSIISGCILIAGALALGPVIGMIPKCSLAAMVIMVGLSLLKWKNIVMIFRTERKDASIFMTTFIAGLVFPLDMAIYLGVATSVLMFLQKVSRPDLMEYYLQDEQDTTNLSPKKLFNHPQVSIIHVEGDLFFGATDVFTQQMREIVERPLLKVLIIRLRNARHIDASSIMAIRELVDFAKRSKRHVIFSGVQPHVLTLFRRSGLSHEAGEENIMADNPANPTLATALAMKRTREILGGEKAEVLLFAKSKDPEDDDR